jgi:hypothetical protein
MIRTMIILILCINGVIAQVSNWNIDTVYCTLNNTSYVIFKDKVDLVDIGSPDNYVSRIEERSVFIRALKENAGPSTILVKTGKDFYYGIIHYKQQNKIFFYDFNTPASSDPLLVREKSKGSMQGDNLSQVVNTRNELLSLGFISEFIEAAVTVIRNDDMNTYLKIILKNKSSIPYKLDFISFQYFRHMKKGFAKKGKESGMDVFPAASPDVLEVPPVSDKVLGYVIPSFGLAEQGYLMILFRESTGDRVLKINVPGSEIQKAPVISHAK